MEFFLRQFKQIFITAMFMLFICPVIAQVKQPSVIHKKPTELMGQIREFYHLIAQANVSFTYPKGFVEIIAPNDEDFSFDYALELPGKDFEIWFQVKSEKENWISYQHAQAIPNSQLANPDSAYTAIGAATATAFTGDKNYFVRTIPPDILASYNADAGKSYLLTLLDLPQTKHYKYALLIALQKYHTGTILMVYFTNEKNPEFFKNINRTENSVKFKP
ncbi:MAG TPA: hypothetical protein DCO83_05595 [Mucilaginibacter sp.]|jgi:hypothetical protein|nr:hypothetical protein [Mucilaginibacter sp.]